MIIVTVAIGGDNVAKLAARKTDGIIATQAKPDLICRCKLEKKDGARYAKFLLCWVSDKKRQLNCTKYFMWASSSTVFENNSKIS